MPLVAAEFAVVTICFGLSHRADVGKPERFGKGSNDNLSLFKETIVADLSSPYMQTFSERNFVYLPAAEIDSSDELISFMNSNPLRFVLLEN